MADHQDLNTVVVTGMVQHIEYANPASWVKLKIVCRGDGVVFISVHAPLALLRRVVRVYVGLLLSYSQRWAEFTDGMAVLTDDKLTAKLVGLGIARLTPP